MRVTVRLYLSFRLGSFPTRAIKYPTGATVARLADDLAIRDDTIGLILVNDRHAGFEHQLADGDTVALFPVVGGG
jgi:molybdopterin converting factor small subunit